MNPTRILHRMILEGCIWKKVASPDRANFIEKRGHNKAILSKEGKRLTAPCDQLRQRTEEKNVVLGEDLDREERMRSLSQDNAIQVEPMHNSASDTDTEVDKMKSKSPLKSVWHKDEET